MTEIGRLAVVGAGTMGHGIAQVAALAGFRVSITDSEPAMLERGMARVREGLSKSIERGKCTPQERDAAVARLRSAERLTDAVSDADVVIEAVPERLDLKQRLFAEIERDVRRDTILASNTSSLSISDIARPLRHPERAIGLHFFNPVPVMKLLEIVRGGATDDATVERSREFATALGKTSIVVRDSPGFATSRLGVALGLEAIRMLEQGVASAEDIDRAMELGYNHPVGPLRLTDIVGLDVRLAIAEHLYATLRDDTFKPPALLREKVRQGQLGKKSGAGFYRWENDR